MRPILFVLVPAGLYLGLCALLFFAQRSMIYFRVPESTVAGATAMRLETDGAVIKVWAVERPGSAALVYFGGNAEDVGASVGEFAARLPGLSMYFVNYRGYGGSTGEPTERDLTADALAVYDSIHARHPDISVVGRSLGSGVAAALAGERDLRRLALVTPFDSLARVAQSHYRWFPVGLLVRDRFDSARRAPAIEEPTLVVIGDSDEIIPRERTDALISAFRVKPRVVVLKDATHNSIDLDPRYLNELAAFLSGGD